MTDHFKSIYNNDAARYDKLVSREDVHGNLFTAIHEIASPYGKNVVELGAGTGRVTRLMGVMAAQIYAFDFTLAMLKEAARGLELTGLTNWHLANANSRALPLPDACADIAIEGWSFAHAAAWYPQSWQEEAGRMIGEMQRVLKPGGTFILIETLGTGSRQPQPPRAEIGELYDWWTATYGLQHRWIRTDYQFASLDEAEELTGFFFGDALAARVRAEKLEILPECTGLWWKTV